MIIVRNVFIAKPGQASKLAAQFKSAAAIGNMPKHRVLTDMTGDFNRVVLEYEVADLPGVETEMAQRLAAHVERGVIGFLDDDIRPGELELVVVYLVVGPH